MNFEPPPVMGRGRRQGTPPPQAGASGKKRRGPLGAIGAALAAGFKFILPALKLLKGAKFLITGATMVVSAWAYSVLFGWPFAVGIVLCIFVHEMGHVFVAATQGVPVSAPIFIPFFGALILQKRWAKSAFGQALIGIGGPLGGTIASMISWGLYLATGNGLFLGVAFFGFMMNLFNMIPLVPLDGGWIVGAVSPYLWLVGLVAFAGMALMGMIRNPFIWILVILSIPHLISGLRRGTADPVGGQITTGRQKIIMGLAYLSLCGILVVGMSVTSDGLQHIRAARRAVRTLPAN